LHSYGFPRAFVANLHGFCTVERGMAFISDKEELKSGLIIFRRGDVAHRNFYCRIKLPKEVRYKTISLLTADRESARDRAFDQDADIRFRVKHDVACSPANFHSA
jgi:hypothetical protein